MKTVLKTLTKQLFDYSSISSIWNMFFTGLQSIKPIPGFSFLFQFLFFWFLFISLTSNFWRPPCLSPWTSDFSINTHFLDNLSPSQGFNYHLYADDPQMFTSTLVSLPNCSQGNPSKCKPTPVFSSKLSHNTVKSKPLQGPTRPFHLHVLLSSFTPFLVTLASCLGILPFLFPLQE